MRILALDFETGGLDPNRHGAVSLGLAVMEDGALIDSREWLIAPPRKKNGALALEYDMGAMMIHKVSWKRLSDEGRAEIEVLTSLRDFAHLHGLTGGMIVSHNAVFDASFLSQMVFRCGAWSYGTFTAYPEPLQGPWACTRRMARDLGLPDSKLDTVAAHFGLARRDSTTHGAQEDAILAGSIYFAMTAQGGQN